MSSFSPNFISPQNDLHHGCISGAAGSCTFVTALLIMKSSYGMALTYRRSSCCSCTISFAHCLTSPAYHIPFHHSPYDISSNSFVPSLSVPIGSSLEFIGFVLCSRGSLEFCSHHGPETSEMGWVRDLWRERPAQQCSRLKEFLLCIS